MQGHKAMLLHGPTGLGKTEYVRSLFPIGAVCELNAKGLTSVCLSTFDAEVHQCILWDEASPKLVADNRKVFQHPLTLVDIGHSPTGQHVKQYYLNDCVSIIASNDWLEEMAVLPAEARAWVLGNAVVQEITSHVSPEIPGPQQG